MTRIVSRAADKVTFFEVKVFLFADAAKFWMLRIEFFKSCSKRILEPAADNYLVTRSRAEHHLPDALVPYEVWQDAKGVHAHAVDSSSLCVPELVILAVDVFSDHFVQFTGIAKLKPNFSVLVFAQVAMNLVCEVDHLLTDFDADEHVVVVDNFREKLSGTHAHLDYGYFVVVFLDVNKYLLEKSHFLLEQFAHTGIFGLLGVDGVTPDKWRNFLPDWVAVILVLLAGVLLAINFGSLLWQVSCLLLNLVILHG